MANSRSQAENLINLGQVNVNGKVIKKSSYKVGPDTKLEIKADEIYVSRAALKLKSVYHSFKLDVRDKVVLDVGSSTGGFTDYMLKRGAKKSIAVDVGTEQLHPTLRADERIELYEKTDIRDFTSPELVDIAVIDVSFISIKKILIPVRKMVKPGGLIIAMLKPQFEIGIENKHKGIVKNNAMRRTILHEFQDWLNDNKFTIVDKTDSAVPGKKGNTERFYLLKP